VVILGNEITGLSKNIEKQCDRLVHLPMLGSKKSLNVSVACGAFLYYILSKIS